MFKDSPVRYLHTSSYDYTDDLLRNTADYYTAFKYSMIYCEDDLYMVGCGTVYKGENNDATSKLTRLSELTGKSISSISSIYMKD